MMYRNEQIEALEKRIAELEAQIEADAGADRQLALKYLEALTTERQWREDCEAVLKEVARAPNRIAENSRIIAAYFGEGN